MDYILKKTNDFEYSVYYNNFCPGFTRQQVEETFEKDLENAHFEVHCGGNETKWVNEQQTYNHPVSLIYMCIKNTLDIYNNI